MIEMRRCGGIGRHAVLRGQWGKLRASSNLAIGTICEKTAGETVVLCFAAILFSFSSVPAHALLLGEKARSAPEASLKNALRYYQRGESHETVWERTRWYCPLRKKPGCRFEVAGSCTGIGVFNSTALRHAAARGGEISLYKVFNAGCVYQRYPSMKKSIRIFFGDCAGAGGWASRDAHGRGRICINREMSERIKRELNEGPIKNKDGVAAARGNLHRIFIHEMQHHIQFAEGWPEFRRSCPYNRRALEREAYYVAERENLNRKEREARPPHWYRGGLC